MKQVVMPSFFVPPAMRRREKLPKHWQAKRFRLIGSSLRHIELVGAVYPEKITRGYRKGEANFRKPVEGTQATVIFTVAEYNDLLKFNGIDIRGK